MAAPPALAQPAEWVLLELELPLVPEAQGRLSPLERL